MIFTVEQKGKCMSNLINREALIESIRKNTYTNHIIDIVNALPSMQLDTAHPIEREPIRDEFNCPNCGAPITSTECPYCGSVFGVRKYTSVTRQQLSDSSPKQTDVIACEDCVHWVCYDKRCNLWNSRVESFNWCCYPERRTNEIN